MSYPTTDYFSWEPEKINVKFYNCENTGKILLFVKFDIYFLGFS